MCKFIIFSSFLFISLLFGCKDDADPMVSCSKNWTGSYDGEVTYADQSFPFGTPATGSVTVSASTGQLTVLVKVPDFNKSAHVKGECINKDSFSGTSTSGDDVLYMWHSNDGAITGRLDHYSYSNGTRYIQYKIFFTVY